ncbi:hypothetical protein HU200_045732 [Digitaria exilis]|uniref:F-box domain-containing protein n=1 Tax=Digitaria exilis TaxID=1010633 RepID=A0A835B2A0_9POAL|nr:hypothetical protein HU200_045732 [Digitaria exilis]
MEASAAAEKTPQLTGPLGGLPWDITTDILGRLPAKSVFRCRGVCKAWRDITIDPGFLAARSRCWPADVVLYKYEYRTVASDDGGNDTVAVDVALDLLPVSSDEDTRPRRLIRYPNRHAWFLLVASSNGVLLFRKEEGLYLLCNPVTRQWAELPRLPPRPPHLKHNKAMVDSECAFYFHSNSGEYRLLCRRNSSIKETTWWILAAGAAEPRRLDMGAAAEVAKVAPCLRTAVAMHVALDGRLHWPPHQAAAVAGETEMVVFDVSLETFHLMAGPPTTTAALTKVFDMDGLLVAADFGKEDYIDLWFLEDYNSRRWELRHRVELPLMDDAIMQQVWTLGGTARPTLEPRSLLSVAAAGDGEAGNIMLGNYRWLVVYNVKTMTTKTVDSVVKLWGKDVLVSRHVFKENLEKQTCFTTAEQCSVDLSSFHFQ